MKNTLTILAASFISLSIFAVAIAKPFNDSGLSKVGKASRSPAVELETKSLKKDIQKYLVSVR